MQPAFGMAETRALYTVFQEVAVQVRNILLLFRINQLPDVTAPRS